MLIAHHVGCVALMLWGLAIEPDAFSMFIIGTMALELGSGSDSLAELNPRSATVVWVRWNRRPTLHAHPTHAITQLVCFYRVLLLHTVLLTNCVSCQPSVLRVVDIVCTRDICSDRMFGRWHSPT